MAHMLQVGAHRQGIHTCMHECTRTHGCTGAPGALPNNWHTLSRAMHQNKGDQWKANKIWDKAQLVMSEVQVGDGVLRHCSSTCEAATDTGLNAPMPRS